MRKCYIGDKSAAAARFGGFVRKCFFVVVSGFILLQVLIISHARTEIAEADCLIVLGAGLVNETPGAILTSRLDAALEYMEERGGEIPVIVSGGQGPDEAITEAEAMSRYLKRKGTNEKLIWKEDKSTSTWENLLFSRSLLKENGIDEKNATIAIVSNEFHLFRAKYIAGSLGMDVIGVAADTSDTGARIIYHCREAIAVVKDFLLSLKDI